MSCRSRASTPPPRFFRFLAALAEFDREAIVEGTREGLASARARGRVGGRPSKLTQIQIDQAQRMYVIVLVRLGPGPGGAR